MTPALRHSAALRREFTAAQRIPYRAHVAPAWSGPNPETICRPFVWAVPASRPVMIERRMRLLSLQQP
jgi:hypothetical protein